MRPATLVAPVDIETSFDASGAGLGAVLTVLTIMSPRNTSTETGCITPAGEVGAPVQAGEHTTGALLDWGFDRSEVDALLSAGVVGQAGTN